MKRALFIGAGAVLFLSGLAVWAGQLPATGYAAVILLDAPINPLTVRYVDSQITEAERHGAVLAVVRVSSGKAYAASVNALAEFIGASRIPVMVLSGGASTPGLSYLEQAAAKAPARGTAEPSIGIDRASQFLQSLDGRSISWQGQSVTLHTRGIPIRSVQMNGIARILAELLNPNLAYVLLLLGIIGIAVEFSLPGAVVPGVVGGFSLLFSLTALGALSVNIGGLLIILLALVLFVLDIKAPTHGVLTAGGIVALIAGSFLLFPAPHTLDGVPAIRISLAAIVVMSLVLSGILLSAVLVGARAQRRKVVAGSQTLIGLSGVAVTDVNLEGIVRVGSEEWSAISVGDDIRAGDEVDVVDVQSIRLIVMRRI